MVLAVFQILEKMEIVPGIAKGWGISMGARVLAKRAHAPRIYELDGSTLRICVGEPGDPRPARFDGGGDYTLEVFKREKPKATD